VIEHLGFFVIAGSTATGKSEFAVEVAERCGGEIVGADAFQIYEGLQILTAQPSAALQARAPHHLVGSVPVRDSFDVAQYLQSAIRTIRDVISRGRLPIVCGGTGLYLRALLRGLADLPAADLELRSTLEARPLDELQRQLIELDPISACSVDLQNPRRVIRALEVCLISGKPFSSFRREWSQTADEKAAGVLLTRARSELLQRISERTRAMFRSGVEDEVRTLAQIGPTAEKTIGYRQVRALLAGEISRDECIASIDLATRQYAKRQATWFRRERSLACVNLSAADDRRRQIAAAAEQAKRLTG
jgi:tRNA dimethylallyltransferase